MAYQFDYTSIRNRLIEALQAKSNWANILDYSANMRIVDAISESIEDLAIYDEYLTRETNFELAQNTSSLMTKAKFLNYDAHRKVASTGTLRVSTSETFNGSINNNIPIPKYTSFATDSGLTFISTETRTFLRLENYIDISIAQGIPRTSSFTASGDNYESFIITNDSIASDYYEVWVNGEQYTEKNRIIEADEGEKSFEIRNTLNFTGIEIIFGNDIFGKKLAIGDAVVFKFIETEGYNGNVGSAGVITTVVDSLSDINGNTIPCYCTNMVVIDGGQDEENVDSIRANAPKVFQAGERAITSNDYEAILELHNYIQHSNVWGAYEYNIDNDTTPWSWVEIEENVVHVASITPSGENLTDTQKYEITRYLLDYKSPTDIVQFEDADIIKLAINVDAKIVNTTYNLDEEKTNISNAIAEEYSYSQIGFEDNIYTTQFVKLINAIESIAYHESYIEMYNDELTFNSSYAFSLALKILPIEEETIKVYLRNDTEETPSWTLVATDDGAGGFTAETGYTVDGTSEITYATGEGYFKMTGLSEAYDDYSIKIYWQTGKTNLILDSREQIFILGEYSNISTEYLS